MNLFDFKSSPNLDIPFTGDTKPLRQNALFALGSIQSTDETYLSIEFFEDYAYTDRSTKSIYTATILLNARLAFMGDKVKINTVEFNAEGEESTLEIIAPLIYTEADVFKIKVNISNALIDPVFRIKAEDKIELMNLNFAELRLFFVAE